MTQIQDIAVLSAASFLGFVGFSLTGFGMAINYFLVYQIAIYAGYEGKFLYAVFIQAFAFFSVQPLIFKTVEIKKFASKNALLYWVPVTIIATPIGSITGKFIPTETIELVTGFLVTFIAIFQIYQKRIIFAKHIRKLCCCSTGEKQEHSCDKEKQDRLTMMKGELEIGEEDTSFGNTARFWTVMASAISAYFGALCGIQSPPIILYFLYPPSPLRFNKKSQRATGVIMTMTNGTMRVVYYLFEAFTATGGESSYFQLDDWPLYLCVVLASLGGVLVGNIAFDALKDSQNNIRMILIIFMLICGISFLFSTFLLD